jgi:signal transduction histidine kinase
VAAVHATAERLLREQPERPERDRLEASIAASAAGLGRLVSDLLCLANLDSPTPPSQETVDLAQLVDVVVAEPRPGDELATIKVDASHVLVRVDREEIRRLVRNLLDNARAAAPGGTIIITVAYEGQHAVLHVADDGPGVPAADRERIFDRFARLPGTTTPGTGLGLAIARRLAEHNGGELTYDPAGVGATFTLRLWADRGAHAPPFAPQPIDPVRQSI